MLMTTFIVRFEDEILRDAFLGTLKGDPELAALDQEIGEFLPDVILRDVPEAVVPELRRLAPRARFMADFGHGLFQKKSR